MSADDDVEGGPEGSKTEPTPEETTAAEASPPETRGDDANEDDSGDADESDDASDKEDDDANEDDAGDEEDDDADEDDDAGEDDEAGEDDAAEGDDAAEDDAGDEEADDASNDLIGGRERYPLASEEALRRAGAGCIIGFAVLLGAVYLLIDLAVHNILELSSQDLTGHAEPVTQPGETEATSVAWIDGLGAATTLARTQNRPILVYVDSADPLTATRRRDELFSDPDVGALAARFVMVQVDLPHADAATRMALQHLGVDRVPVLMFLHSDLTRVSDDTTVLEPGAVMRAMRRALEAADRGPAGGADRDAPGPGLDDQPDPIDPGGSAGAPAPSP